jgi:hypothetical protein
VVLSGTSCVTAQIPDTTSAHDVPYVPLTLEQKFTYSAKKVFGPGAILSATLHAGLDQADKEPTDWGMGSDAFGVRMASRFGRSLIRQNIAFGVRAIDHEDPRYFVLGHGDTNWKRTRYAMVHEFVVRNDNGTMMPAYSRLVADFGMPFIAQQWRPTRFQTVPEGLRAGSCALALGAAFNVGREFWPDIRKRLLETRLGSHYAARCATQAQSRLCR